MARFQSTCPRGARRRASIHDPVKIYFNPRAHEGHDPLCSHPPASTLFQSTCPRGARLSAYGTRPQPHNFNPRAHEGHDVRIVDILDVFRISIHVPTRGTTYGRTDAVHLLDFNPRAHEGHDEPRIQRAVCQQVFQSTCPRGARLCPPACLTRHTNFNPRAHEGHDKQAGHVDIPITISIHVPTRGTTKK